MHVYFLQTVPGVGQRHTIGQVRPGYARNFLFPKKLATAVTPARLQMAERERAGHARAEAEQRKKDEGLLRKLQGASVTLRERANGDRLFGSVTSEKIQRALAEQLQAPTPAAAIKLAAPLRVTGSHVVPIRFPAGETSVTVTIEPHDQT